jgi:hypothetical protein
LLIDALEKIDAEYIILITYQMEVRREGRGKSEGRNESGERGGSG